MLITNVQVCMACEQLEKNCPGPCRCTVNGNDAFQNSAAGQCPVGRFNTPLSEIRESKSRPCNCTRKKESAQEKQNNVNETIALKGEIPSEDKFLEPLD